MKDIGTYPNKKVQGGIVHMLQKNNLFLSPQAHFGSLEYFEEELANEITEIGGTHPCTFFPEKETANFFDQKIGLFICWAEFPIDSDSFFSAVNFEDFSDENH